MADSFSTGTNADDGTHQAKCERCEYVTLGWPSKTAATQRIKQHLEEHDTGVPMPELAESGINRGI